MLAFMAYELVANLVIQKKLQREIDDLNIKLNGLKVNYDSIQNMKYMDQVVCETLRKWPPAAAIDR